MHHKLFKHLKAPNIITPGVSIMERVKLMGYTSFPAFNSPSLCLQHVVVICKFIAAWFVPSAPMQVKNDRLFDKLNRLKEELR